MGKISQRKQAFAEQVIRESAYAAVLQVLSEYGLEKLTVQRVAAAANLGTGTLYNYFKDKDALMVYAAVRLFEQLRQRQSEAVQAVKDPLKQLHLFLKTTFEFFTNNIVYFRFLDQSQVYCKIDMAVKHGHVNQEVQFLSGVLKEGIEKGQFKKVDPEKTAIFFHRALVGTLCIVPELGDFQPEKEAKLLLAMFKSYLA